MAAAGAQAFVPDTDDVAVLAAAAEGCRGCELYENATQTVFGAGAPRARLMLVGEQPGDVEDQRGEPFVGPAGALLDRALADAGLDGVERWTTNAVKHFRWRPAPRGKRRLHQTPTAGQSTACRPWLGAELAAVRPEVLVALGATAAASLFGSGFRLTGARGAPLDWPPARGSFAADPTPVRAAFVTLHPSAVLRADPGDRDAMLAGLVADLRLAREALG